MRAVDIIMKKRGDILSPLGKELTEEELRFLIQGYVAQEIPEYQIASWLMAVYFNGMTFQETAHLTDIMLHSGETIDLSDISGVFVDKHSTGGVGDKISLPLAPIVAACGVTVPMMSGRALGHTGGTLDKLESIDGYKVQLSQNQFKQILQETGFAMIGQTKDIVPADRLLYALRDVTGTVESIPLITASILSKKIAEGANAFVFDVKFGNGAFMKTPEEAEKLALSLVKTAQFMGKKATAVLTNMNTPLGYKIGNFLEIEETIACLQNKGPADVMELTYTLGAEMLLLANKAKSLEDGLQLCKNAVLSGSALKLFLKNIDLQGGNSEKLLEDIEKKRSHSKQYSVATQDGYLTLNALEIGLASVSLGVGRNKTTDSVCPTAGIILHKREGDFVQKGDVLMEVFGKDDDALKKAQPSLDKAIGYDREKKRELPLILKIIR